MLYLAAEYLTRFVSGFNLFTYITMRAILGALTALVISLLLGPGLIRRLQEKKIGQTVRDDGPGSSPAEGRHAHHGRHADPARDRRRHAALGRPAQPLSSGRCSA